MQIICNKQAIQFLEFSEPKTHTPLPPNLETTSKRSSKLVITLVPRNTLYL